MSCAPHRPYLAAIADGELDLVPASTLAHVRTCPDCGRHVATHSLLTDRLRQAIAPARGRRAPALHRAVVVAAAALLVAITAAGLAALHGPGGGQDRVAVAAAAARGPLQFSSGDDAAIGTCPSNSPAGPCRWWRCRAHPARRSRRPRRGCGRGHRSRTGPGLAHA